MRNRGRRTWISAYQIYEVLRDRVSIANKLDFGVADPSPMHGAQDPINFLVCGQRPLLVHKRRGNVEEPTVVACGLCPPRGPNGNSVLTEAFEQPFAVVDLILYQRDCIHRNTPSGSWLIAS